MLEVHSRFRIEPKDSKRLVSIQIEGILRVGERLENLRKSTGQNQFDAGCIT